MDKIKIMWKKLNDFAERTNEKFTDWCLRKIYKYKKMINVISISYIIFPTIVSVILFCIYIFFSKYNRYTLICSSIITLIIVMCIPSYLYRSSINDSKFSYPKICLFLCCGQIIEIIAYIVIFIKYSMGCINDNLIYYILGILLFRFIQLYFVFYIKYKESKFSLDKWFKESYVGYGYKVKKDLKCIICKDVIYENHYKLKNVENKILNKFKTKENLLRERFLVEKKIYFFENFKLINIILVIFGLMFTVISPIFNLITATYQVKSLEYFKSKLNVIIENDDILILFMMLLFFIFIGFIDYTSYKDKKMYLNLLDYLINNYENFYIKHNIKQLCLRDEFFNKYYLTTIFIEYSNKLIKQEELKDTIKFLEENGIQIIFCSNEIEKKDIEKCLKNCNLFSYDYTILDKKEIGKIKIENNMKDKGDDDEFYQILSEKLGISTNEKFIISESEEKIKLGFVDFEDKYFCNFSEVLKFLQSKME